MSKKNKRPGAADEVAFNEDSNETEETVETDIEFGVTTEAEAEALPEQAAEDNITVSEEPENISPAEEVTADEVNGADTVITEETVEISETTVGTVSRPVNFRTGPTFKNAVIIELKAGAKVTVTGSEAGDKGNWYKCEFDGRTGYVKASGIIIQK